MNLQTLSNQELVAYYNRNIQTENIFTDPMTDMVIDVAKEFKRRGIDYSRAMDQFMFLKKTRLKLMGHYVAEDK